MFARILAVLPLVALLVSAGQCNTGNIKCCNSYAPVNSQEVRENPLFDLIDSLIDVNVEPNANVGLNCSPVAGAVDCQQQPVCCENNDIVALVAINCSPINIVL